MPDEVSPITLTYESHGGLIDPLRSFFDHKTKSTVARVCHLFYDSYQSELTRAFQNTLLTWVIRGEAEKIKKMLDKYKNSPEALLNVLSHREAIAENRGGWQEVGLEGQTETLLQAALRKGDREIIQTLMACYEKLGDRGLELIQDAFNTAFPDGIDNLYDQQKNDVFGYSSILQAIKDAPEDELKAALNPENKPDSALYLALENYRRTFAVKSNSDKVFNSFHIQKAARLYALEFDTLSENQRHLFWQQVVGFTHRFLPASFAKHVAAIIRDASSVYYEGRLLIKRTEIDEQVEYDDSSYRGTLGFSTGAGSVDRNTAFTVENGVGLFFQLSMRKFLQDLYETKLKDLGAPTGQLARK